MNKAAFSIDTEGLAKALRDICDATDKATDSELNEMHESGYIPSGVLAWLLAIRGIKL